MRRAATLLAALLAVLALPGAEGGCGGAAGRPAASRAPQPGAGGQPAASRPPQPDPHAGDPQPGNHKERIITINVRVSSKQGLPAVMRITTVGGWVQPGSIVEPIADTHRVTKTLTFDANAPTQLSVLVTLTLNAPASSSWCSIEAGAYGNDGPRFAADKSVVTCVIGIKRPR